jgi:DNA polymerase III epsilon subunit-like protein
MLSIDLVDVYDLNRTLYTEFQPISERFDPEALAVSGLDRDRLVREGTAPAAAMADIAAWATNLASDRAAKPVFVGFNAPFDWMFYNWYAHHFAGHNPFGFAALDIKAFYMGKFGAGWADTKKSRLDPRFSFDLGHNALGDAIEQAQAFRKMLEA